MSNPTQLAFLEALGWTILNSWWQFGVLWVLMLFLKKVLPRGSAAFRHNMNIYLLLMGVCWTVLSFILRWNSLLEGGYKLVYLVDDGVHTWWLLANDRISQALPFLSIVYLLWLAFYMLRFSRLLFLSLQLRNSGLQKTPVQWRLFLNNMAVHMNIQPQVELWISDHIDTPVIMGWLKPIILLPVSTISLLSTDQLEAILIHELAHVKRNDYFWNSLVTLVEIIFFFNPFVRRLVQEIRMERENSCDDWVLQFPYKKEEYAHALLALEQQRIGKGSKLLLAAGGYNRNLLLLRVQRMLDVPLSGKEKQGFIPLLALVLFIGLLGVFEPRRELRQTENPSDKTLVSHENEDLYWFTPVKKKQPEPLKKVTARNFPKQQSPLLAQAKQNSPISVALEPVNYGTTNEEEGMDPRVVQPAALSEALNYSMLEDKSKYTTVPVIPNNLPYVPRSSFEAIWQRDSIIPPTLLENNLGQLKVKEAELQEKIALVDQQMHLFQQQNQANADGLNQELILKKSALESLQKQVEKQSRQYEEVIEKQLKIQLLQEKKIRKRKIIHI